MENHLHGPPREAELSMESGHGASIQLGTPGTIDTPMTASTVHTMNSSVGETYSNYNGDTWADKNSVKGGLPDQSFDQDSLSNIPYSHTPKDNTVLQPIYETSDVSNSVGSKEGAWLQGHNNSISSFTSPYMKSSAPASVIKAPQQAQHLQQYQSVAQQRQQHRQHHQHTTGQTNAESKSEGLTHVFLSAITLILAASLVIYLTSMDQKMSISSPSSRSGDWWWSPSPNHIENPTSNAWINSVTASIMAKKSSQEKIANVEADWRVREEAKLTAQRLEVEKKQKQRETELKKEHATALLQASKEAEEKRAHERARRKAEEELRAAEEKHAVELRRHRELEEKRDAQRKEELARLKATEAERVKLEATKQAKLIYDAKMKEEREKETKVLAEKTAAEKVKADKARAEKLKT